MRTKLLVADDSITIQKVVGIIFASEDYELTIVNNGDAALAKALEVMPDVLLVDAVMPGKTGYEVCEEVRRDPALKGTPILLLTGAFEPFDEGKARQCGADDFISKPFESQHLIDKVISLADLGRQRATAGPASEPAAAGFAQTTPPAMERPVPPPPAPQPAPPAVTPAPQAEAESFDFFTLPEEAAPEVATAAVATAAPEFELEMVDGSADDDLWGAFELEDVAEGEAAEFEESPFEVEVLAAGAEEVEEPFVFADQEEPLPPKAAAEPTGFAPQCESGEVAGFSFGKEAEPAPFEIAPEEEFVVFEEKGTPVFETGPGEAEEFFVETVEPAAPEINAFALPAGESDLQFAREEEYMPTAEALTAPAPAAAPAQAPAAEVSLSEEQLAALVARISKDIIEKIAWEVVPDLAERIISEEIRKIKEGV